MNHNELISLGIRKLKAIKSAKLATLREVMKHNAPLHTMRSSKCELIHYIK
ncbi:MAG: hypothetical protein QW154_01620 [Sulfolobales archaeon]